MNIRTPLASAHAEWEGGNGWWQTIYCRFRTTSAVSSSFTHSYLVAYVVHKVAARSSGAHHRPQRPRERERNGDAPSRQALSLVEGSGTFRWPPTTLPTSQLSTQQTRTQNTEPDLRTRVNNWIGPDRWLRQPFPLLNIQQNESYRLSIKSWTEKLFISLNKYAYVNIIKQIILLSFI